MNYESNIFNMFPRKTRVFSQSNVYLGSNLHLSFSIILRKANIPSSDILERLIKRNLLNQN